MAQSQLVAFRCHILKHLAGYPPRDTKACHISAAVAKLEDVLGAEWRVGSKLKYVINDLLYFH